MKTTTRAPRTTPLMQTIITTIATKHRVRLDRVGAYLRLDQPGYDRLSVEVIGQDQISVAHYFEQNGDLIADPEIVFWTGDGQWTPIAIGQALTGWREVAWLTPDGRRIARYNVVAQPDVASFARLWARNLVAQRWQDIEQPTRVERGEDESTDERGQDAAA